MPMPSMASAKFCSTGGTTSYNKSYALHSLTVVRATPHRAKGRATSHKKNVICNARLHINFILEMNLIIDILLFRRPSWQI